MKIPIHNHVMFWNNGSFRPEGKIEIVSDSSGPLNNPFNWDSQEPTWAARVIVGFKRQGKPPVTMDELVQLVWRIREEQVGNPSSTFLTQRGLYQHKSGAVVDEPGAQVVLINTPDLKTSKDKFIEQVENLAEDVATELGQDEVIVEIQKDGITQRAFGMGPRQ